MNKEIDDFIQKNMPDADCHPAFVGGWCQGAEAMAEHLQSQPPTKEQLKKIFNISKRCPMGDVEEDGEYHSYLGFDGFCEYIIRHWTDDTMAHGKPAERK